MADWLHTALLPPPPKKKKTFKKKIATIIIMVEIFKIDQDIILIKGEPSPNFTFWDESARGWSTYWKVITQNITEIGEGEPL